MSSTLIIPDIHNRIDIVNHIIDNVSHTDIVFLGDYFDSFFDGIEVTEQTARWLKESLKQSNRTHLIGNHDLSYLTKNKRYRVSGFSWGKRTVIQNIVKVNLKKLKHYCWVGDWLCTHAGLSNEFYQKNSKNLSVDEFLSKYTKNNSLVTDLYGCSGYRGGKDEHSGILWCDYREFVQIPSIKQIFGHTAGSKPRKTKNNVCLDTWNKYYAVYKDDKLEIKKTSDIK